MVKILSAFVVVFLAGFADAQDAKSALSAPRGTVLILDNSRLLEGDITQEGDVFRIRRGMGEITIPAARAKKLCSSVEEAFQYMKNQAQLADPDERLRLAKWCLANGLNDLARDEGKIALQMRPQHADTKQFLRFLDRPTPTASAVTAAEKSSLPPAPEIDISADSYTLFANKVQAVLINTCGHCHTTQHPGKFQLYRAHEGGGRAATQRNLAAALAQVSLEKPVFSPLLTKAISNHAVNKAMEQAPIKSRQAEPYRLLQAWVEQVVVSNPHLRQMKLTASAAVGPAVLDNQFAITTAPTLKPTPPPVPTVAPPRKVDFGEFAPLPLQASKPVPSMPIQTERPMASQVPSPEPAKISSPNASVTAPATTSTVPNPLPPILKNQRAEPRDEFDESIFNAQFHRIK